MADSHQMLTPKQAADLLALLAARFAQNMQRHPGIEWAIVQDKLARDRDKLLSLAKMEGSGGEPDVVGSNPYAVAFYDCAPESPAGRRNLCYDGAALAARKANKPSGSAVEMAASMGIALLTEAQYRILQQHGTFDSRTSSWIATPDGIRSLGGALFCDRRYDHVFVYHNGAESYYASRGFRGVLQA